MEERFRSGDGLDPASIRRMEGQYPALASAGGWWSLVWVRGEEVHLRTEGPGEAASTAARSPSGRFRRLGPGDSAPEWSGTLLNGAPFDLPGLRGEVILLTVWATWCAPCRKEMPALNALHDRFRSEGLSVVGVSVDDRSAAGQIPRFLEEFGIGFPIVHDPEGTVQRAFTTMGVPETFLIGRDGRILYRWVGAFDSEADRELDRIRGALAMAGTP